MVISMVRTGHGANMQRCELDWGEQVGANESGANM